jgi:hypothetical protein
MHLDIEALVSLHFGELPAERARPMLLHLSACALCRHELDRLRLSTESAADAPFETARLLAKIRHWDNSRHAGQHGEALKQWIARELALYVGEEGANRLLRPVQEDGRDLLAEVAPLLSMFLGRRAAGILVSRMVEKTIVGMTGVCES